MPIHIPWPSKQRCRLCYTRTAERSRHTGQTRCKSEVAELESMSLLNERSKSPFFLPSVEPAVCTQPGVKRQRTKQREFIHLHCDASGPQVQPNKGQLCGIDPNSVGIHHLQVQDTSIERSRDTETCYKREG